MSVQTRKYRLTYFNAQALAEPIRILLAFSNIDFEDVRISKTDWPSLKSSKYKLIQIIDYFHVITKNQKLMVVHVHNKYIQKFL